jgi:hypothetical protein
MPTLSGSLNVTGSVNVTGSFTLNGNIVTSGSITSNGSTVVTAVSTGSFVVNSQTGSFVVNSQTGSFATTGSNVYVGNQNITGSMVITGSLTISGSGTLTNIGPARFRSNIANSTTVTAVEITGGLQVSRSIDSVNRYLSTGTIPVVQWGTSDLKLVDANNNTSVMWGARNFFDENGLTSIDWNAATSFAPRTLLDNNELASVKWNLRQLVYSSGSTAFNWGTPDKIFMSGSVIVTGSLVVTGSIAVNTGDITVTPLSATTKIAITDGFMKNEMKKTSTVIANQASPYNISLGSYVYDPVGSPFFPVSNAIYSTGATDLLISSTQKLNIEATSTVISSSLSVSGSTTIDNILTLVPRTTTPTGIASGSIIVSGSATGIKPYFWNGLVWTALF